MSVDTFYDEIDDEPPDRPSEAARLHESLPGLGNFVSGITRRGWRVRGVNRYHECIPCGVLGWDWKSRGRHDEFHDRLQEMRDMVVDNDARLAHLEAAYIRIEDKLDRIYRALFQQEPPGRNSNG